MISGANKHWYLFLQMLRRDIQQRYRGTQLGFVWAFIYPVLMLLVYTFVFGMVMRVKWGIEGQDNLDFGIILFAGLLLHGLLAEVFIGSVGLITGNSPLVKKVVFPLMLLSLIKLSNALFHYFLGSLILLAGLLLSGGSLHPTILLAPIVLAPFVIFLAGISWAISVLGVYMRDLGQFIGVLITVLLFLGPIVYPFSAVPEQMQPWVLWLNPLTIMVEQMRAVLLFGQMPNWGLLGIYTLLAIPMFVFGYWFFETTRDGFADVI